MCHIVNLITGEADGVFNHLLMIFNNYDKSKFQHFLIFQGNQIIENKLNSLNVKYYVVSNLNKKFSFSSFSKIFSIIRKEKPQILQTHLIKPYIIAGFLNIILRKPMIFNYHGSFINNDYNTKVEQLVYAFLHRLIERIFATKLVLVPSKASKSKLSIETNLFKNIHYYYNGCDETLLRAIEDNPTKKNIDQCKQDGSFLISVIGRINREKRIDRAVEIFEQVVGKYEKSVLFILGDGEQYEDIKRLVEERDLSSSIFLLGFVEDAQSYLNLFDLLLITSEREGMPMVLWEALAQGVPVVSSDVGGIREIVETYDCGFVFKKDETQEAVEKISLLMNNDELRKKMGENGKRIIEEKFNQSNFIKSIEGFYLSLVNE